MNKSITAALAVLALVAVFFVAPPFADAQQAGKSEGLQTFSASAATGIAAVDTATGKKIVVESITLASSAAGVVVLKDGSNAGTTLLNVYLSADTTLQITPEMLNGNLKTTAGNCLFIADVSATITGYIRYSRQL